MMIRAIRASDAAAAGPFLAHGPADVTARTWPRTPPESRRPTFVSLIRALVLPTAGQQQIGAAFGGKGIAGIVVVRARASGLVWDVEHLIVDEPDGAVQLLMWACDRALAARARRVFVETPADVPGIETARRAGFERYTEGIAYSLDPGFSREGLESLAARPRLRSDELGLFQLYNTAIPANVRAAEAMTQEEWAALYRGPKLWRPSFFEARQDYVWEIGPRVAGWMRVTFGQRSQYLELSVHPLYEAYADRMVRYALVLMSTKVPVLIDVREYQTAARAALEHAGFRPAEAYAGWVRQLASRAPQPNVAAIRAPASPG
ncbi:MAG: hypothetical protein GEU73_08380 [Chloroflexi bacterium]|nr:hypothetical protein [Chloroflexota bacterium]